MGVIPTLVRLLGVHSQNTALTEMCLIAFGNLAELGELPIRFSHTACYIISRFSYIKIHQNMLDKSCTSLLPDPQTESSKEQFASTNIAEELVRLFRKQVEHEKREMIFEVLAPLAENGENHCVRRSVMIFERGTRFISCFFYANGVICSVCIF